MVNDVGFHVFSLASRRANQQTAEHETMAGRIRFAQPFPPYKNPAKTNSIPFVNGLRKKGEIKKRRGSLETRQIVGREWSTTFPPNAPAYR